MAAGHALIFKKRELAMLDPSSASQTAGGPLSDVATIRRRARQQIEKGAVTPSYTANRDTVLRLLNEALATELVCTLRYRRHYFMANGALAEAVKNEFLAHAQQEQAHADLIAERIVQLGGEPDFNPDSLARRSHAEYREGITLEDMLREDLVAERIAIESYREMIEYLQGHDPTTRRMLEEVLAVEEEHAEELASMLQDLSGAARNVSTPRV
jgi:bacterioferritin